MLGIYTIFEKPEKDDKIAIGDKKFVYNQNRKAKVHEMNKNMPYHKRRS